MVKTIVTIVLAMLMALASTAVGHQRHQKCKEEAARLKRWVSNHTIGWKVKDPMNERDPLLGSKPERVPLNARWLEFDSLGEKEGEGEYGFVLYGVEPDETLGEVLVLNFSQGTGEEFSWYHPCQYRLEKVGAKWRTATDFPLKDLRGWFVYSLNEPPFGFHFQLDGLPPRVEMTLDSPDGKEFAWVSFVAAVPRKESRQSRLGEMISYQIKKLTERFRHKEWYNPRYHRPFRETVGRPTTKQEGLVLEKLGDWTVKRRNNGVAIPLAPYVQGGPTVEFDLLSPDRRKTAWVSYWLIEEPSTLRFGHYSVYDRRTGKSLEKSPETPRGGD